MGDGRMLSATEAASILHRDIDIVIQHLLILILKTPAFWSGNRLKSNARFLFYYLKPEWRLQPNVLDFGFCSIDLSSIPDYSRP